MRQLAAAALVAVALAGCAGGDEEAEPAGSPEELLAQAADRLREQATFSFESTSVRTRADRPDDEETFMDAAGAVDLEQGRGRATVELDLGLPDGFRAEPRRPGHAALEPVALRSGDRRGGAAADAR